MDVAMDDYRQQAFAKPRYGYCDSYFVESHEDMDRRRRDEMRARERDAKKRLQLKIAEQLSAKASQEFRAEHIQQMELLEVSLPSDHITISRILMHLIRPRRYQTSLLWTYRQRSSGT